MERRRFGPTEREVPVIGQGTWTIDSAKRDAAIAALRRGLDLGMTHIDTAEMYGGAEEIVGEAIAGRRDGTEVTYGVDIHSVLPGLARISSASRLCSPVGVTALMTMRLTVVPSGSAYRLTWLPTLTPLGTSEAGTRVYVTSLPSPLRMTMACPGVSLTTSPTRTGASSLADAFLLFSAA